MIVEVHPHLGGLQFSLLDARNLDIQLFLLIEIVIPIQPMVVLFFALVPDIVIPAMKAHIGVIRSLRCAYAKTKSVDQDDTSFTPCLTLSKLLPMIILEGTLPAINALRAKASRPAAFESCPRYRQAWPERYRPGSPWGGLQPICRGHPRPTSGQPAIPPDRNGSRQACSRHPRSCPQARPGQPARSHVRFTL
jgi:hypothetical protein